VIQNEDRQEYHNFCLHHLRTYGRPPVEEVWHYTTAEGLIAILKEGKIFSTQVTCLNDNREQRYFGDLLHEAESRRSPVTNGTRASQTASTRCAI
jgi:hypothetical protein